MGMNERKVIKDLKERNEKLSQQYDFNRVHLIALENKNHRLKQQLQAYKDKEDKLRELIDNYIHDDYGQLDLDDILQILNEGSE
jgi:FtsZ-binding cell division protein ZapB